MDNLFYNVLGAFGFGHPLHPVLITMVVGPVIAAFIFGLIAIVFKVPALFKTIKPLTILAFVCWFPTVAVGIIDWIHFYGGSPKMVEIIIKIVLAGVLFLILLGTILLFKKVKEDSIVPVILMGIASLTVSVIGYYGGNIVFGGEPKTQANQTSNQGQSVTTATDGFKKMATSGYTIEWKIDGANISFRVGYETNGWVGIGFGKTGTMDGSHIILGYVGDDNKAVVEDHFGYAKDSHSPESELGGKNSLIETSGTYSNKITTIAFKMPLKTSNPKDPVLSDGETYKVILANGGDDAKDVTSYHGREGRIIIDLKL